MMLKEVFLLLVCIATAAEGVGFPNLLGGVLLSAPPGFSPVSRSWGSCRSETAGYLGNAQSNKACVEEKLKAYHYKDEGIALLIRIANSEPGAKHPTRQGDKIKGIEEEHKKRMCKAAADCQCSITLDWCPEEE